MLDSMLMIGLVFVVWAGSVFEMNEHGFSGDSFSKVTTSIALFYLCWHFVASRKPRELYFSEDGVDVPNTWLPGVLTKHIAWQEIRDIDVCSKKGLVTICLYLNGNNKHHIYVKALKAYYANRLVSRPGEKLFIYLCQIVGIEK
ncbi:hypothetical protein [Kaarinaea lacus]